MLPLLQKLAKVQDVRPYIKKIVKGQRIHYQKLHRVFRDSLHNNDVSSVRRSQSTRSEVRSKTTEKEMASHRNRGKSQTRGHQHIRSQYQPIIKTNKDFEKAENVENVEDPNTASTAGMFSSCLYLSIFFSRNK